MARSSGAEPLLLTKCELSSLGGGNNLLQSGFWGEFKGGWESFPFRYEWRGESLTLLVLVRRLARVLPIAYVPFGPELTGTDDEAHLRALGEALLTELPLGTLFVRFDLTAPRGDNLRESLPARAGLRKAPADIQPPDTVLLDIGKSEDDIRAGMHKKWRYNINLAQKKGVRVVEASPERLGDWYELYRTTGERDKIALHPESYYRRLFDLAGKKALEGLTPGKDSPDVRLWLAYHEEDLLAGIITSFYGNRATYLYGASSNHKRNLMPAYALQWAAIRAAKEGGCGEYDFFGIPPADDPDHPMHGLYRFKVNFGGEVVHYAGCWDRAYGRLFYTLYCAVEKGRQWYYKRFKKR
ncbi:MAG: peptidoglycan bridge formation glycyltransferase FemA/FemB family protein [Spirochaetales bacterium]|nr:peptidoglycan bridge formation glycyltransferase FemA/FemB family protein [Spirochaetales bacterium]